MRIREIIREQNGTSKEIAKKAGITEGLLSNIITGKANPSLLTLTKVANALNVPMEELFARQSDQNSMVSFFHYRGVSKTPTEMEEVMLILKEWKSEEFHALCQSHSFQYIRETFSQDTSIQSALDELCRLLPQVCEDK